MSLVDPTCDRCSGAPVVVSIPTSDGHPWYCAVCARVLAEQAGSGALYFFLKGEPENAASWAERAATLGRAALKANHG